MMVLEGSCHCGAVRFSLESEHPYPFNLCYCSICRKTAGGGGFAINLGGRFSSLKVDGEDHIRVYRAHGGQNHLPEGEAQPQLPDRGLLGLRLAARPCFRRPRPLSATLENIAVIQIVHMRDYSPDA